MPDEEYIVRFTIETAEAIQQQAKLKAAIDAAIKDIQRVVNESNSSVAAAAASMVGVATERLATLKGKLQSIKADLKNQLAEIRAMDASKLTLPQGTLPTDKSAIAKAKASLVAQARAESQENQRLVQQEIALTGQYVAAIKAGEKAIQAARAETRQIEKKDADIRIREAQQNANNLVTSDKQVVDQAKNIRTAMQMENKAKRDNEVADAQIIKAQKQALIAAEREYQKITKQGYGEMSQAAKAYGAQISTIKNQITEMAKVQGITKFQAASQLAASGTPINQVNQALKELNTTGEKSASIFQKIGHGLQIAFGISVYTLIMKIVQGLSQAVTAGYNFSKSLYQLAIGVNALRRGGLDITLADVYTNLDKLQKKFGVFSKVELVEGSAQLLNLIRDFNITTEELYKLQDAIATLAVVNGRAMDEVQRTVALALSSGYTEGLQRLGVSINRVNIALKAEEMGFGRVYMSLTENQRYQATLALLLQKTAKYSDDLTSYQKELAGQIDTTAAAIKDMNAEIGRSALVMKQWWLEIVQFMSKGILTLVRLISSLSVIPDMITAVFKPGRTAEQVKKDIEETKKVIKKELENIWSDIPESNVALAGVGTPDTTAADKAADELMDIASKLATDLMDLEDEKNADLLEAEKDFWDDMQKINDENTSAIANIWEKYYSDVEKISAGLQKDIAEAQRKAEREKADINRDFNNKLAESNAKYRENQLKAEIDYQERLKKLREGFLMDLEDALHERDARQILRLIRQYNLQRTQAKREYDINLEEMKRAHALELEELAKQRAERLRGVQQELTDKITAIQAEAAIRLAEAVKTRDKELEEQRIAYEQEKAERDAKWEQEKIDIETRFQDRLNELAKNLALENKLTQEQLDAIAKIYESVYGPNGRIQAAFDYAMGYMARWRAMQAKIEASGSFLYNPTKKATTPWSIPNARASGGIDYVTEPTLFMAGEGGDEMVITKPLTRSFSGQEYLNGNPISGLSDKKGSVDISLLLSPDLTAKIVRQSGDYVANVMLEVQRQK